MKLPPVHADPAEHDTPLLVLPVFRDDDALSPLAAGLDDALGGSLTRALEAGDLRGTEETGDVFFSMAADGGPTRVLLLGVGSRDDYDGRAVRRYVGRGVRAAEERRLDRVTVVLDGGDALEAGELARTASEAAVLAAWRFRELKTGAGAEDRETPVQVEAVELAGIDDPDALVEGIRIGGAQARGENFARTLQARPGNVATPTHLADEARAMAREVGLRFRAFGPDQMRDEGMEALLAVASGSRQEPRLIFLEHEGGDDEPPLVLVGKGLTFDAGGISIKPSKGMEEMKFDMSGGAAVLGAMRAVAELEIPRNVVGVVPSSENLPDGMAVKPGDVVRTREGKTVEIINTDAEGRLILADALSYARTYEPEALVDCATLTGACVVALGHHASAVMGNDDGLVDELRDAGERSGERCWPLPLWSDYRKQLESETADLKNVGGRPAGSITAGCFLREFVGDVPWGHLDIAGTAYGESPEPYQRKGGHGIPTRLLVEWVRSRAR